MVLPPGSRLGPFEILACVGAGGMGEVYRARDTRLDRTVAIKVLTETGLDASPRRLERFRREARAIARITHPNICTLHDVCEQRATTFLVMEFVEGETLARRLESGALPLATALKIAVQVADALDHAHHQGVVHRDLKPSNIMLMRDRVKLLDFGLAKLRERDEQAIALAATATQLTGAQTIVGTAPYMAPEQIEGRDADARTDLFALGIVLYEMIAGRRPFEGDSRISLLAAIVATDPPSLCSVQPATPPAVERLVARCLAKHPDDRWQTARDLAAELRWVADSPMAVASPASVKSASRRALSLTGAIAAAAGAAAVAAAMMLMRTPPASEAYSMVTFRRGIVSSARFAPDGNIVYSASWDGQPYEVFLARAGSADARALALENGRLLSVSPSSEMAVLFGSQVVTHTYGPRVLARVPMAGGARRDLLEGVVDADWIPGTNDLAVVRMQPGSWHVEFPIGTKVHEAAAVWSLRVSPDGSRIAFFEGSVMFGGAPDDMITVVDRGGRKSTLATGWSGMGLAWAPSGREVWFTATRGPSAPSLHAASLSGTLRSIHADADWLVLHDIARDGRVLLTRNTIRQSIACHAPGESEERDLTWLGGSQVRDISSDGQTLVFIEALYTRMRLPAIFRRSITGQPAVRLGDGGATAISPDGRWTLALADNRWSLLPNGAGSARVLDKGTLTRVDDGRWLPDGKQIVFAGWETGNVNERPRIYAQDIDGGPPRPITPAGEGARPRIVTPDGRAVVGNLGTDAPKLYPIDGGTPRPIPALTGRDLPIQWSADATTIYAVADASQAWIPFREVVAIDVTTGRRTLWKTVGPSDRVGVDNVGSIVMTPDARAYCYTYLRRFGGLFSVDGLR